MKRRDFVKNVSFASITVPFIGNSFNVKAGTETPYKIAAAYEDRVLVLIRMNGGNDGLNTVIPLDQYANLNIQRPSILIPQPQVLQLNSVIGLHPAMTGMRQMYQNGKLSVIQNVGYPAQNRSHFRSTDIWTTGLMDISATQGWLGRMFQNDHPAYPDGFPNAEYQDPFAISMGYDVSSTCQGIATNFSHVVSDPAEVVNLDPGTAIPDNSYFGQQVAFLQTMIDQSNAYGLRCNAAVAAGNNLSTMYTTDELSQQLKFVAKMISGGLKTNVYIVNVDGFDTHDAQVEAGATSTGKHAELLGKISDAVAAFQNDLQLLGIEQRVAGMTFSEFGRQVAANASQGTDHGDAAPMFVFGSCVSQGIIGQNPVIGDTVVDQEGVPMQIDFRDIYASFLREWFGLETSVIQNMYEHAVTFYPVMGGCNLGLDDNWKETPTTLIYPNPCYSNAILRITTDSEWVKASLFDANGSLLKLICDSTLQPGVHDIQFSMTDYASGAYLVKIEKQSGASAVNLVKR
jgi:uncharacterized protein (DUF1501 family)